MRYLVLLALLAPLVLPGDAYPATSTNSWLNYCSTGAMNTCASVHLVTVRTSYGTKVYLFAQNLQGFHSADNTGGSVINKIGIVGVGIDENDVRDFEVRRLGDVRRVGDANGEWEIDDSDGLIEDITGNRDDGFVLQADGDGDGGILGCDLLTGDMPSRFFQTCATTGYDGWVVFSFETREVWRAEDAQVAWQVLKWDGDDDLVELACFTGGAPTTTSGPITSSGGPYLHSGGDDDDREDVPRCVAVPHSPTDVVPEPITMVLLGTGLAGIGGTALRRRRQELEIEEE